MRSRKEIVTGFYDQADEDARLPKTRHGQLEYYTTMTYIHRCADKGSKVLEVGAGTGRYAIALAREGMDVTAVELAESNLKLLFRHYVRQLLLRELGRGAGGKLYGRSQGEALQRAALYRVRRDGI